MCLEFTQIQRGGLGVGLRWRRLNGCVAEGRWGGQVPSAQSPLESPENAPGLDF